MRRMDGIVVVTAILVAGAVWLAPAPAQAFSCAVPAIQSAAKRTVCFSKSLRKLNGRERDGYAALARDLKGDARTAVIDDHWKYLETLEGCKSDKRCLEATYEAQLRLYQKLAACKSKAAADECAPTTIEAHRQELHKSL